MKSMMLELSKIVSNTFIRNFFAVVKIVIFFIILPKWPFSGKITKKNTIFTRAKKCRMNVFDAVLESLNTIFFTLETHRTTVQHLGNTWSIYARP